VLAGGLNGGIPPSLEILVLRGAYGAPLRQLPFLQDAGTVAAEQHRCVLGRSGLLLLAETVFRQA
jgi:hypothetical protein